MGALSAGAPWAIAYVLCLLCHHTTSHPSPDPRVLKAVPEDYIEVQTEDDLIRALPSSLYRDIVLISDIALTPSKWPTAVIERDVYIRGHIRPSSSAIPVALNFNFVRSKWTIAPGCTVTFQDLDVRRAQAAMGPGVDVFNHSPDATVVWSSVWMRRDVSPDLQDAAQTQRGTLPRPQAWPGAQQLLVVNQTLCQKLFAFPAACGSLGLFYSDLVYQVPDVAGGPPPKGGYTVVYRGQYLTTDRVLDPECVKARGQAQCSADARHMHPEYGSTPPSQRRGGGVSVAGIVGAVVGALALMLFTVGLLLWWRYEKLSFGTRYKLVCDYAPVLTLEGTHFPEDLMQLEPDADPLPGMPAQLQKGVAIGELVGVGSFGMCHRGVFNGRPVALKLLMHTQPETTTGAYEEVQATAMVRHPNIVTTYGLLMLDRSSLAASGKASIAHVAGAVKSPSLSSTLPWQSASGPLSPPTDGTSSSPTFVNMAGSRMMASSSSSSRSYPGAQRSDLEAAATAGSLFMEASGLPSTSGDSHIHKGHPCDAGNVTSSGSSTSTRAARRPSTDYGGRRPSTSGGAAGAEPGVVCLVLEYCEGGSLQGAQDGGQLLGLDGYVDLELLFPLLLDVVEGMHTLHSQGLVHGDLKADNIMLTKALGEPCSCSCHSSRHGKGPNLPARGAGPGASARQYTAAEVEALFEQMHHVAGALEPAPDVVYCCSSYTSYSTSEGSSSSSSRGACGSSSHQGRGAAAAKAPLRCLPEGGELDLEQGGTDAAAPAAAGAAASPAGLPGPVQGRCCQGCRPRAKIADFGLVHTMTPATTHVSTCSHGTVTHMPPEVLMEGQLRPAADVYGFGVMVCELITGQRAWRGYTYPQIVRMVGLEGRRLPLPSSLPNFLQHMLASCWAPEPRRRPSFSQLLEALAAAADCGLVAQVSQDMHLELASVTGFL